MPSSPPASLGPLSGAFEARLRAAHERRERLGLVVYLSLCVLGLGLLLALPGVELAAAGRTASSLPGLGLALLFALAPAALYVLAPIVLDRFDPEPRWALAMAFVWGALGAAGWSVGLTSLVEHALEAGPGAARAHAQVVTWVAPAVEELFKGAFVVGLYACLRREFDGVSDAILYALLVGLGFAATENVVYYARAAAVSPRELASLVLLRGVFTPWLHPLFTALVGLGVGLRRESSRASVRALAPVAGFALAAGAHASWNALATRPLESRTLAASYLAYFAVLVLGFFGLVVLLVSRKGRIIRAALEPEVLSDVLTREDLELVASPWGRVRCRFGPRGRAGLRLIETAGRLALAKWHSARAARTERLTLSVDLVAPLRADLARLSRAQRGLGARAAGQALAGEPGARPASETRPASQGEERPPRSR